MLLQQIQLEPLDATVHRGSDVQFKATVVGLWEVMTWHVRGLLVLTILPNTNISSSPGRFSATFCSSGDTGCVDFIIHNVTQKESGPVICTVQGEQGSKTAQLNIQESGTVTIVGGNITAVQDQHMTFQCITAAWFPEPTITWATNGRLVDSSLYNTTSTEAGDAYNSTSVLQFQALSDTVVECLATVQTLTEPRSSLIHLVVVPKPPDWTVLKAVVVSFGGIALLVLLIAGITFCYKRRKEKKPNYQQEMSRRVKTQGQVNTVYVSDNHKSAALGALNSSGFCQAKGTSVVEMPHVKNDQAEGCSNRSSPSVDLSGFRKHRHATIV
ncbi:immunoglobulin superfamily member 5 isoform X3 [Betta splendens]|uniref:immunoglobulin superfamily member 5 isoform X2 n=1 Tax=Betta splendens TaxID=158456 RepID=UPI0010FA1D5C|nr:immunoglobulin superfamily member 5 isoform X2 [Betta splendens]XP_055358035.1 immunoglobulin superfamily member 5 isoform X3 [Betta splendens]